MIYIGVDQTGAIDKYGVPKPLPGCLILNTHVEFFYLPSLSKKNLYEAIPNKPQRTLNVCIDCVLGLPQELELTWRSALALMQHNNAYGMKPAQEFFRKLGGDSFLRRQVEIKCNANSVFKEKPFQKNIQTGTYRIWKDISLCKNDFNVPFLGEKQKQNQVSLFEGYPSLSWKLLFDVKSRKPEQLKSLLKMKYPKLVFSKKHQQQVDTDPNLADAFVLALSLREFTMPTFNKKWSREGSILGFNEVRS